MPTVKPAGSYKEVTGPDGVVTPWYMIPFDKKGRCKAPATRQHLLDAATSGRYTDVFVFSHGWNNTWVQATDRYEHFITNFQKMRAERALQMRRPYRPLLVGVHWPSAILVDDDEDAPAMAGGDVDALVGDDQAALERLGDLVDEAGGDVHRLYELLQLGREPDDAEVAELAALLSSVYADDELAEAPTDEEVAALWATPPTGGSGRFELASDTGAIGVLAAPEDEVAAAGLGSFARDLIRQTTVWMMKDRAGKVGRAGGHELVVDLLNSTEAEAARLHLLGHSFGCKLLLAALCAGPLPRPVSSALLLQAAVNHRCFADDRGDGRPGGYRSAIERVDQPILATFSRQDSALRRAFPIALRRKDDVGEAEVAAAAEPSKFAALGAVGPWRAAEGAIKTMPALGVNYDVDWSSGGVIGLDAAATISGHSDITNAATWWALWAQVAATDN